MVDYAHDEMTETGTRLLWGTTNAFSHPRFAADPDLDPDVFAYAAAQVKNAIDNGMFGSVDANRGDPRERMGHRPPARTATTPRRS